MARGLNWEKAKRRRTRQVDRELQAARRRRAGRKPPVERVTLRTAEGRRVMEAIRTHHGRSTFMRGLQERLEDPRWRPTKDQARIVLEILQEHPESFTPVQQAEVERVAELSAGGGQRPMTKIEAAALDWLRFPPAGRTDPWIVDLRGLAQNPSYRLTPQGLATVREAMAEEHRLRKAGEL